MGEWKLFEGDVPHVSTFEFHEHRERAPHVDQPHHRPRLERARDLVMDAVRFEAAVATHGEPCPVTVSDLGCGDGGLLSLLADDGDIDAWGYDFQPSNVAGWKERGVRAWQYDVFGADRDRIRVGRVAVVTEVLEHLADPHGAVRLTSAEGARWIVASSPWQERPARHDECHAWAWDLAGYQALIRQGGYTIEAHDRVGPFQLILGRRTS